MFGTIQIGSVITDQMINSIELCPINHVRNIYSSQKHIKFCTS